MSPLEQNRQKNKAHSVSLTITPEVSFDFLSYWYLNVLIPNVFYYIGFP